MADTMLYFSVEKLRRGDLVPKELPVVGVAEEYQTALGVSYVEGEGLVHGLASAGLLVVGSTFENSDFDIVLGTRRPFPRRQLPTGKISLPTDGSNPLHGSLDEVERGVAVEVLDRLATRPRGLHEIWIGDLAEMTDPGMSSSRYSRFCFLLEKLQAREFLDIQGEDEVLGPHGDDMSAWLNNRSDILHQLRSPYIPES